MTGALYSLLFWANVAALAVDVLLGLWMARGNAVPPLARSLVPTSIDVMWMKPLPWVVEHLLNGWRVLRIGLALGFIAVFILTHGYTRGVYYLGFLRWWLSSWT